jgi:hypothetical protein
VVGSSYFTRLLLSSTLHSSVPDSAIIMPAEAANGNSVLDGLRNMEELAALGQFLFCFGTDVLSLPDFDREVCVLLHI